MLWKERLDRVSSGEGCVERWGGVQGMRTIRMMRNGFEGGKVNEALRVIPMVTYDLGELVRG